MGIHPHEFFKIVEYHDTLSPCLVNDDIAEQLMNVHPSQIVMLPQCMILYRVPYSYITK